MPSSREKPPSKINDGKYEIEKSLGAGCFGEVFRGHDVATKEQVAVKFETTQTHAPQLENEAKMLQSLAVPSCPQGFAKCHYYGVEPGNKYNCMVMELLGKSLEDRVQGCNGKFDVRSSVLVAEQMLCRIEYLHSKGIIHRDIKPENFLFGVKDKVHHVYLIDFGLSKRFWDNGRHIAFRTRGQLTGTARYASINAHEGMEQSRRDDLEAIGHMLMYFLRGSLPWSGLEAKTQEEKYRKIKTKKQQTPLGDLCEGFPDAFKRYLEAARKMEFRERPDYVALRQLFKEVRVTLKPPANDSNDQAAGRPGQGVLQDHNYQWFDGRDIGTLVPLQTWEPPRQPDDLESRKPAGGFLCGCFGKGNVRD